MIPVSELQSLTILEWALRAKAKQDFEEYPRGLGRLMRMAVAKKWIGDEGLPAPHLIVEECDFLEGLEVPDPLPAAEEGFQYVTHLSKILPKQRNELAHGTRALYPGGHMTFALVAGLINQLWPPTEDEVSEGPPLREPPTTVR